MPATRKKIKSVLDKTSSLLCAESGKVSPTQLMCSWSFTCDTFLCPLSSCASLWVRKPTIFSQGIYHFISFHSCVIHVFTSLGILWLSWRYFFINYFFQTVISKFFSEILYKLSVNTFILYPVHKVLYFLHILYFINTAWFISHKLKTYQKNVQDRALNNTELKNLHNWNSQTFQIFSTKKKKNLVIDSNAASL